MEAEQKHGSVTIDRELATGRLADYLRREGRVPEDEAHRRAGEMVTLLGGSAVIVAAGGKALAEGWWLFGLRGLLAIGFGILALAEPLAALGAFVLLFGVWAFVDGVDALVLAARGWRSWQVVILGLIGVSVGVFTFFRPGITAFGLYAAVAAWAIARGMLELAMAIELRREIKGDVWLIVGGIASVLFGVLMILLPWVGVLALAWLIGVYALLFGAIMCALSLRLRRLSHEAPRPAAPLHAPTPQPT